jgi:hypothetical protein
MRPYKLKNIDDFERFRIWAEGYLLYSMQYAWNNPEGFHAWYLKSGEPDIEIVTYCEEVQKAIIENGTKKL